VTAAVVDATSMTNQFSSAVAGLRRVVAQSFRCDLCDDDGIISRIDVGLSSDKSVFTAKVSVVQFADKQRWPNMAHVYASPDHVLHCPIVLPSADTSGMTTITIPIPMSMRFSVQGPGI
jgi:hypothetical protein